MKGDLIITGGSGGIGSAIIQSLDEYQSNLIVLDKSPPRLSGKKISFRKVDLTEPESLSETVSGILKEFDILNFVHCAGYGGPFVNITELSPNDWDDILSINYISAFRILRGLLPVWKVRNYGRFIGIASSLSLVGKENSVAYSGAKHALYGFSRSVAAEWGKFGITSNCISPGYVETPMGVQEKEVASHRKRILEATPSGIIAEPGEIARVVKFMLSTESGYINGANWTVDGGITAI